MKTKILIIINIILTISFIVLFWQERVYYPHKPRMESDTISLIEVFNSQFISFEGEGRTATQIRSLTSQVNASNANIPDRIVTINGLISFEPLRIQNDEKYKVSLNYGPDGYIYNIEIALQEDTGEKRDYNEINFKEEVEETENTGYKVNWFMIFMYAFFVILDIIVVTVYIKKEKTWNTIKTEEKHARMKKCLIILCILKIILIILLFEVFFNNNVLT